MTSPPPPVDDSAASWTDSLIKLYTQTSKRLQQIVLHPPGDLSAPFNQARASSLLAQINQEVARLKTGAAAWTGPAFTKSVNKGAAVARRQASAAGVKIEEFPVQGAFDVLNTGAVKILVKETYRDLSIGADGMASVAKRALVKMEGTGVSVREANQILAGRAVIEGKPVQAIRELRTAMEAVNGEKTAIACKDGITREYDTGYYAELIGRTKTREAVVQSKHDQFSAMGLDLVKIVGRISVHFCTDYLGHVYSISGRNPRYPALASLPNQGPPFHPQCSKSTAPFIEGLSKLSANERSAAA